MGVPYRFKPTHQGDHTTVALIWRQSALTTAPGSLAQRIKAKPEKIEVGQPFAQGGQSSPDQCGQERARTCDGGCGDRQTSRKYGLVYGRRSNAPAVPRSGKRRAWPASQTTQANQG